MRAAVRRSRAHERAAPVEAARIKAADDGDVLDLGGRRLELLHAPGHAKHHLAVFEPDLGALFAGDGAITQLWLFILAPTVGGLVAGFTYAALLGAHEEPAPLQEATEA